MEVEATVGSAFEPMRLSACTFKPKGEAHDIIYQHHLTTENEEQTARLKVQFSAPIGIMPVDKDHLKDKCRKCIRAMLKSPGYLDQTTEGDPNELPHEIIEVMLRYQSVSKDVSYVKLHGLKTLTFVIALDTEGLDASRNALFHGSLGDIYGQIKIQDIRERKMPKLRESQ